MHKILYTKYPITYPILSLSCLVSILCPPLHPPHRAEDELRGLHREVTKRVAQLQATVGSQEAEHKVGSTRGGGGVIG